MEWQSSEGSGGKGERRLPSPLHGIKLSLVAQFVAVSGTRRRRQRQRQWHDTCVCLRVSEWACVEVGVCLGVCVRGVGGVVS